MVFISYANRDSLMAQQVEQVLSTIGINIWRDKTTLRAGEIWPKALGEAIVQADAFLLLWSKAAAKSEFVELEWTIALAVKCPIILNMVDNAPLPPSLKAVHGIAKRDAITIATRVKEAMRSVSARHESKSAASNG